MKTCCRSAWPLMLLMSNLWRHISQWGHGQHEVWDNAPGPANNLLYAFEEVSEFADCHFQPVPAFLWLDLPNLILLRMVLGNCTCMIVMSCE